MIVYEVLRGNMRPACDCGAVCPVKDVENCGAIGCPIDLVTGYPADKPHLKLWVGEYAPVQDA